MLIDGLNLLGGSEATNFTIASGVAFPTDTNSTGELFYLTSGVTPGLHIYDGADWAPVTTGAVDFDSLSVKAAVRAATTANITLSGTQTIDGVAVIVDDRVLVKNQSTSSQNGVYVAAAGAWARATDFDGSPSTEVKAGDFTFVTEGTTQADTGWVLATNGTITVGTTAMSFAQFTSSATSAAGANTQVQYNNGGEFEGSANLTFNGTLLGIGGTLSSSGVVGGNANLSGARGTFTIDGAGSPYGTDLYIRSGSSSGVGASTNGGFLQLKAGNGSGAYAGGDVVISTGSSSGSTGGGEYNSAIRFLTSTNAGATAERMRITQSGAISFGSAGTAVGTSGQVLTSSGPGTVPTWQTIGGTFNGGTITTALTVNSTSPQLLLTGGTAPYTGELRSVQATTTNGGGLLIKGGGTTVGSAGQVRLEGASAAINNAPGQLVIAGANGLGTAEGAPVYVLSGSGGPTNGGGGLIYIESGTGTGTANGGPITLKAGNAAANAGPISITAGTSSSNGTGGAVNITGGTGVGGTGGAIIVQGGTGAVAGAVTLQGGSRSTDGIGGSITLIGGSGLVNGAGGTTVVEGGVGGFNGNGGQLTLNGGRAAANGVGGVIVFQTAAINSHTERFRILNNGAWSVGTGGTATGTSGQVLTSTGATTPPTWQAAGGGFNGGTITSALTINTTGVQLYLGGVTSAGSGTLSSFGGTSTTGGALTILAGGTTTGVSGLLTVRGGQSASGSKGGSIIVETRDGTGGGGSGDITVTTGEGSSTGGTSGSITIQTGGSGNGYGAGTLNILGGNNTTSSANAPSSIVITAGSVQNVANGASAGSVTVSGGNTTGAGGAGNVTIRGGTGASFGGEVIFSTALTTSVIERFRIKRNGAWSVGTDQASTGTSGQVLTSTGAATPPTWQSVTVPTPSVLANATVLGTTANTALSITGIAGTTQTGTVTIIPGQVNGANGNQLILAGGLTNQTGGGSKAGNVTVRGGDSGALVGGDVTIRGGNTLTTGTSGLNSGGDVTIAGGSGTTQGAGGTATLSGGNAVGLGSAYAGGAAVLSGGSGSGGGAGGSVTITSGLGSSGGGASGAITIAPAAAASGVTAGTVLIRGADGASNTSLVTIRGGDMSVSDAGSLAIRGGNATGSGSDGGAITLTGGNATNAASGVAGAITIRGGNSNFTGGANVVLSGGTSTGANGGGSVVVSTALTTSVVERVRITNTGALAFSGAANYGTAGQFLASNGNAAPSWQSVFDVLDDQRLVTAGAYSPSQLPAHSAAHTFDAALSNVFEPAALTGDTTVAMTNPVGGQTVQIRFEQDATGGRVVTVPAGAKISGTPVTAASRVNWLIMTYSARASRWEGNWLEVPA